jgi:hypothetical protein
MRISRPTESAYETASPEIREVLDQVVAALGAIPEWSRRTGVLIEMIDALDLAVSEDDFEDDEEADIDEEDLAEASDDAGDGHDWENGEWKGGEDEDGGDADDAEDGAGPEPDLAELTTYYVGAVLERLDEKAVTGVEQAAFYMLSCHPEHLEAAQSWLVASPENQAAFEDFIEANPDYAAVLDMVEEMYADLQDGSEDD